jgi:cell division septation protein DedD
MPSRESELYKDKIEVSLDGRQIFYLFFGGAVIVGMVFVLGVMVGRRVEARGHLDRAEPSAASDPLAALDRLERSDHLSFHGALTGSETPTDVEKAIGELEKRRAATHAGAPPSQALPPRPEGKPESKPEGKPAVKAEVKAEAKADAGARSEPVARPEADKPHGEADRPRAEADKPRSDKRDADRRDGDKRDGDRRDGDKRDGDKREGDRRDADKHDGDRKVHKHEDGGAGGSKSDREARPDRDKKAGGHGESAAHADSEPSADKARFTLQLSSFQDKAEAEAFLTSIKSAGFQPYLTEADVSGKGTFYRVRLGSYRSLDAANDARSEYEKASRKSAQVMRL